MPRVEFHCHTIYSKDCLVKPEKLVLACRRKGIQRVAVTDHNTIFGALCAYDMDPELVIVGEEIMTTHGELLAFFVKEEIPPGLTPYEAIDLLRQQEAFISVSHPFDVMRKGHWKVQYLLDILPLIDAIEVFNSRCMKPEYNQQAEDFARQHQLLGTVGSDAHVTRELGRASMELPDFHNARGLRTALDQAKHRVVLSSAWIHLTSRYAVMYKQFFRR